MSSTNPLVSVVVITYNSSKYIVETLNSVKKQTYKNIELIITDDCSTDNTVSVIKEWLSKNKAKFVCAKLIESTINTGVTANYNRGIEVAAGIWIKGIAGDDIMLDNCIECNLRYALDNPSDIIFSKVKYIGNDGDIVQNPPKLFHYGAFDLTRRQFTYKLLSGNFLPAATSFMKKSLWLELERFDENIPMQEDWCFWIKAQLASKRLCFVNEETVKYRIHQSSVSNRNNISQKYLMSEKLAMQYSLRLQKKLSFLLWINNRLRYNALYKSHMWQYVYKIHRLFNPMAYYQFYINRRAIYKTKCYE